MITITNIDAKEHLLFLLCNIYSKCYNIYKKKI